MEKKLEVLKRAMDEGARTSLNFHDAKNREDAKSKAKAYAEALGVEVREENHEQTNWFEVYESGFYINVFFKKSREEKLAELEKQIIELKEESA